MLLGDLVEQGNVGRRGKGWSLRSLDGASRQLVVGEVDGDVQGFSSVRCTSREGEVLGSLEVVYVRPSLRRVGLGSAMVAVALRWCRDRGCKGVDAPALPGSRPAKAFFEGSGFVARLIVMHHQVEESIVEEAIRAEGVDGAG